MKVKAVKNFANSPDGINIDQVKKGDAVDVDESSVAGMVAAGQIEDPKGKSYAKVLEASMTTKGKGKKAGSDTDEGEGTDA